MRLGWTLLGLWCAACAPKVPPEGPAPGGARPARVAISLPGEGRLHAIPGEALVVPRLDIDASSALEWERWRRRGVRLLRLEVELRGGAEPGPDPWLGDPGRWRAVEVAPDEAAGGAVAAVVPERVIEESPDILARLGMVQFLPAIDALPRAAGGVENPWAPLWPAPAPRTLLNEPRFANEACSPLTRWRYRLLVDGLDPRARWERPFDDDTIELVAQRLEDRWRVALAWLWGANADTAQRLKRRLAGVVEFPGGVWAPAWPLDVRALERLLNDLLEPNLTPPMRAAVAERWLDEAPGGVAWVIDDAGALEADGDGVVAAIGVANVQDRPTLAWAAGAWPDRTPDLIPLKAMQARELLVQAGDDGRIGVNVGGWSDALRAQGAPLQVRPPGLALGPLQPEWSMGALTGQTPPAMPALEWTTGVLLHRLPPTGDAEEARWEVFVECRLYAGDGDADRECVVLHVGPAPARTVRAWMHGRIEGDGAEVEIVPGVDRWWARFKLSAAMIEPWDILRFGVVRIDALGRRWSTPRAMLPWQTVPGRIAVNTRSWDEGR